MASGKITNKNKMALKGSVNTGRSASFTAKASASGGGSTDHNRLINREQENQHPIEAISGLRKELDSKLNSETALPLIDEAISGKAKGLYFDAMKEFARKPYWYLTAEIDPVTKMGDKNTIISGPYDLGAGGGGGGGGVTSVSIKPYEWPSTVVVGAKTELTVNWSSTIGEDKEPTGAGTLYLTINAKQVEVRSSVAQGLVTFDVSKYLIAGTNNIQIKVLDMYGTTGVTVNTLNAVTLELKSDFNADLAYTGTINYTYTPFGDVEKTVHFVVDGKNKGKQIVKSTGESQTFQLSDLGHGSHSFEVYFTAIIGSQIVKSNSLYYDLIYYTPGNKTPIIASTFNELEQEQFISFNIPYRVFIYDRNTFDVQLFVNGESFQKLTVGTAVQYWNYKNDNPGNYTLTIACGTTTKVFEVHISKSSVELTPITTDLALGLTTQGRSNAEPIEQRTTWKDAVNNISCELTNFNWSSNGWVNDANGNTVLRVSGDARVRIPYKPFEEDFKTRGKTIELELATSAVRNYSSTIISCLDKARTDFFTAETSFVQSETRLKAFDVELNSEKIKNCGLTLGSHVLNYTSDGWVYNKEIIDLDEWGITLKEKTLNVEGKGEASVYIGDNIIIDYSLQARGFYVTPQVAVFRSQQSALSSQYKEEEHVRLTFVIERNTANRIIWMYIDGIASGAVQYPIDDSFRQLDSDIIEIGSNDAVLDIYNIRIYDNSLNSRQVVNNWIADTQDPVLRVERFIRNNNYNDKNEIVISQLPADLPYIIWDIQPLPEYKGDKRLGNARYVDPANPERSFTSERAQYNVQGTSSSVYPIKNIRIKYKAKDKDPLFTWYDDNGDTVKSFPITYPGGIGDNYFTYKVDYASSEGANNVELVKLYNEAAMAAGIFTPPQREELLKVGGDYTKVMTRVGIDGFPIVAFHQDADGNVKFCTKANFNNDKANEDVYGFADGDESWEIANNSAAEGKFQVPITVDNFENGLEIRFPDEDGYNDMSKLGPMSAWLASTFQDAATNEVFAEPVTFTYEETTKAEDGTFSKTTVSKTFEADTKEYRLTKFKAELKDWFNVDSTIFYYIFTLLFLMIDSRAKNAFPTYFKSRTEGDGGDRWFWIPYDMDTAIGIDNKGKLSFDYNLEDFDKLDGANVYNGQDSVIWVNLREAFAGEIAEMYANIRTQRLIDYDYVEKLFLAHQGKWTENIFNEDASVKYIAPLANGDNYLEMLQGSKAQQRKWWLYNRFKYMDSKFNAGDAKADFIQFRAYVDAGVEKPNIVITPYADIYATVSFANSAVGTKAKRAKRNEPIIIENPFGFNETETDQETYIYSASQLKSIGDISPFHPDTVKVGNAVKLQELKIGDESSDYTNPYLSELTLGSNTLLKTLDVRNCINLKQAIDISKCINIEEIYFSGTQITGITLPDGGNIKKLYLPETLTKLTIKNQPLLTDLQLAGTSNIESLWLENIPSTSIDARELVAQMKYNSAVRIIGMNESYTTWEEIEAFYQLLDTMSGLDSEGLTIPKAQVTGTIHVPHIPYAKYVELSAKYPEVKIDATQIICTVTFVNEGAVYNTQNVVQGYTAITPDVPTKPATQANYFTFATWLDEAGAIWTSDCLITRDITITADYDIHIQQYTATFETDSDIISVEPASQIVYYNTCLAIPQLSGIPEGVELIGWFAGDKHWQFEGDNPTTLLEDTTLVARWKDANLPAVTTEFISFDTFRATARDNLGISAYGVAYKAGLEPDSWTTIKTSTEAIIDYKVTDERDIYFWVKDKNENKAWTKVEIHRLSILRSSGIDELVSDLQNIIKVTFKDPTGKVVTTFAQDKATISCSVEIDPHFKDLQINLNGSLLTDFENIIVDRDLVFSCTVQPKIYTVNFITGKEIIPGSSSSIKEASQQVTYLHKIEHPAAQYYMGEIIDAWYDSLSSDTPWEFNKDVVTGDITLYAKWIEYRTPTKITIKLESDGELIGIDFTQRQANSVLIDWGDSGEDLTPESAPDKFYSSAETLYVAKLEHIYAKAGTYVIKIWGTKYGYNLGNSYSRQVVNPASVITAVDFAWDLTHTADYAFLGANITELHLTGYMKEVSTGAFAACTKLKSLTIPKNITILRDQAFSDCSGLEGTLVFPNSIIQIGNSVFYRCSSLEAIVFEDNLKISSLSKNFCDGCKSIKKMDIPAEITKLNQYALANMSSLEKVILRNPNLRMDTYVFAGNPKLLTAGPIHPTTPGSNSDYNIEFAWDKAIPGYAFYQSNNARYLQEVTLPEGIESIGLEAFGDTNLMKINFPTTLKSIGPKAFYHTSLYSIDIPETVQDIGAQAFSYCYSLSNVTLRLRQSTTKVLDPTSGWFYMSNTRLKPKIPAFLVAEPEANLLATNYGAYWNVYGYDVTTGKTTYLMYSTFTEDDT